MAKERGAARTTLSEEALAREARFAGFAIVNSFLRQQRILADYLDMPPTKATIFLTILLASVQRYVRRPTLGEAFRGPSRLPRSEVGSISRRAVAAATQLPRETVRRCIGELIAEGAVLEAGRGAVTSRIGELESERSMQVLGRLAAESRQLMDELTRLEVIAYR